MINTLLCLAFLGVSLWRRNAAKENENLFSEIYHAWIWVWWLCWESFCSLSCSTVQNTHGYIYQNVCPPLPPGKQQHDNKKTWVWWLAKHRYLTPFSLNETRSSTSIPGCWNRCFFPIKTPHCRNPRHWKGGRRCRGGCNELPLFSLGWLDKALDVSFVNWTQDLGPTKCLRWMLTPWSCSFPEYMDAN